jgi:hypothetical protein
LKCSECGNTFQRERVIECEVITCQVCDATYKATMINGKIRLEDYMFEEKDLGEL